MSYSTSAHPESTYGRPLRLPSTTIRSRRHLRIVKTDDTPRATTTAPSTCSQPANKRREKQTEGKQGSGRRQSPRSRRSDASAVACSLPDGGGTPATSRLGRGGTHSAFCPMRTSPRMAASRNVPPTQPPAPARRRGAARPAAAAATTPCRPAAEPRRRTRRHPTRARQKNYSQDVARESRPGRQEGATAAGSGATARHALGAAARPGRRLPRQEQPPAFAAGAAT